MPDGKTTEEGVGLALSGGGYRATLFHIGTLWRLNELGYLPKLKRICSVSGGSITAGVLGLRWKRLNFNEQGVADNFVDEIVQPLQKFCSKTIDVSAILGGWLSIFSRPSDKLTKRYDEDLFHGATLQDLPADSEGPRFIIYATNLQTSASVRFSKPYLGDYHLGTLPNPKIPLATAVAASSAFPPVLTPVLLKTNAKDWQEREGADLYHKKAFRKEMILSDGGVYDNMGLEAIWDRYETVLVSDAGAPFDTDSKPFWIKNSQVKKVLRVLDISVEQNRSLRKRWLIQDYINQVRKGSYWGIDTNIDNYELDDLMVKSNAVTTSLSQVRTRLNAFSDEEQGRLINWGYALADSAMRRYVIADEIGQGTWPMPKYTLGE